MTPYEGSGKKFGLSKHKCLADDWLVNGKRREKGGSVESLTKESGRGVLESGHEISIILGGCLVVVVVVLV